MTALAKNPDGSLDYHAMMAMPKLIEGARVQISSAHLRQTCQFVGDPASSAHLRQTCQFVGDPAPTSHGPFARGKIAGFDEEYIPGKRLAWVMWDDGNLRRIRPEVLWPSDVTEPA